MGSGRKRMIDTVPREEVTPEKYRELETLAMARLIQLPHHDLNACLIVMDIERNVVRRWLEDERLAKHRPFDAMAAAIKEGTVVKLSRD